MWAILLDDKCQYDNVHNVTVVKLLVLITEVVYNKTGNVYTSERTSFDRPTFLEAWTMKLPVSSLNKQSMTLSSP